MHYGSYSIIVVHAAQKPPAAKTETEMTEGLKHRIFVFKDRTAPRGGLNYT